MFFASLSRSFLQMVLNKFGYFRKPISPLAKFVLTVFWCSTSYTPIVVLWKLLKKLVITSVPWWLCLCLKCVSYRNRIKKLEFSEMHFCLWPGAQTLCRHKWQKLAAGSLLLLCVDGNWWLGYLNEFILSLFQVLQQNFVVLFFTETFAIGFQKWFDHDWNTFVKFCWNTFRLVDFISAWTEIWKKCSNSFSFCRHQIFSMISLRGIPVCSSKKSLVFRHRTFLYRLISFTIAMKLFLLCLLRLLAQVCLQVVLNKFHFCWKLISPFSKFVSTVFRYSTSYSPIVVPWKMFQEIVNDSAPRWPCTCPKCVMCFWPAKTRRNLNFFRCIHVFDLVLKFCSDRIERIWLQLLFYFFVLTDTVAWALGMTFLSVF